ncbi:DUF6286 domain-containing protein [Streptomyces sp. PTM05]|uniref:DUF6286 domain-containing protein n=1 Tax=Streptantibioticus parmotrematis TaxID=2873249 RepID=A0ABS7QW96_9ACTN|nr:DUF6286 domain-containing protein [Streptantibioticus parmotrematis]MBY8887486.1 DUF6286 domain-containing protein [Streptantibioticus parmotrematis]
MSAPEEPPAAGATAYEAAPTSRARRFWSARRVPAAVTAALALAVTGPLLYDVASVRAGRHALAWRVRLAGQLSTRQLRDQWVLIGAGVAVLLGLWLIVLALTPGVRGVLRMRQVAAPVRAGLDRTAAAGVVRQRVLSVPGVFAARATVTRRRIKVRAHSHFRDLDEVRGDLDAALAETLGDLGLAGTPLVTLSLRRTGRR